VKRVAVTGADGFIGRHVREALGRRPETEVLAIRSATTIAELKSALAAADVIVHLAGVNRPRSEDEYAAVNAGFTKRICEILEAMGRATPIVFASSTQAELPNPYGESKREAEEILAAFAHNTGAPVTVFRLTNVFGKWCRPRYNSAVATFCHAIAHGEPFDISDPSRQLRLVHVDDVVGALLDAGIHERRPGLYMRDVRPVFTVTLGALVAQLEAFRDHRRTLILPDFSDLFVARLHSVYLSYLPETDFAYPLEIRRDQRGELAEFLKTPSAGQIFVSRTRPGISRGNHYHHLKVEKFLVLEGEAVIRFRQIERGDVLEYPVRGQDFRVVDIPPGYTHSIENVGSADMVVLFWASEIFDPTCPDTYFLNVIDEGTA
jgi:UDP-2-acetamido-2,6-beta-L-arabino-hexul-4-ose reductase